nr:lipase family protein [Plesiomonas shigelloides]
MNHSSSNKFITTISALLLTMSSQVHSTITENSKADSISTLATENGLSEAAHQYLLRYPSISGVDGKTIREDTAAIFIPFGPTPEGGWPVVVWAHGTVGVATHCAPSINQRSERDKQYLNTWLSLGYAVVAPDYAGLGSSGLHHYLDAQGEAWSIIDGVKAALKKFPLKNEIILVGQSQGAHAAFATAGYQAQYAPELKIKATIITGVPYFDRDIIATDILKSSNDKNSGDPKIPYILYMYLSAADTNPSLTPETFFQEKAIPLLMDARNQCITKLNNQVMHAGININNALKPEINSLLNSSLDRIIYPTLKIEHPVFIGIGSEDINVPTEIQKKFAERVQASGTEVDIHVYDGLDHSGTVNASLRDSIPFILKTTNSKN